MGKGIGGAGLRNGGFGPIVPDAESQRSENIKSNADCRLLKADGTKELTWVLLSKLKI